MTTDVYFKKVADFRHGGQLLRFRVSQGLFSSYDIDIGTQRLLRSLANADAAPFRRILDLGCGYGPLGLTLKKLDSRRTVHLVDRDALAVEYARQNAALNGLADVMVYGSLGYDDLRAGDFDLILCNIPAKAGEPVIAYLLRDAVYHLRPGGLVAIVVVTALEPTVDAILADPGVEIQLRKAWPGHTVFHYRFSLGPGEMARPAQTALERGVYDRQEESFSLGGLSFPMGAAYSLSELDALAREAELLLEVLLRLPDSSNQRVVVLNPGQGHVPVALWRVLRPAEIHLIDRDLLSLRYSRRNLLLNGCPEAQVFLSHQVGLLAAGRPPADLIAGVLREEEGPAALAAAIEQVAGQVTPGGAVVLAGSSTAVTRLVSVIQSGKLLRIQKRERRRGKSLLLLRRRSG